MTKDEIKALVAAKIAGQGSMVDVGGGLPTILNEIIDLIPEGGGGGIEPYILKNQVFDSEEGVLLIAPEDFAAIVERLEQGLPCFIQYTGEMDGTEEIISLSEGSLWTKNMEIRV